MIVVDVNVIVYALRREFPQHDVAHAWLGQQLVGAEGVVISDAVLAAAVRLLTHHKVLAAPMTPRALRQLVAHPDSSRSPLVRQANHLPRPIRAWCWFQSRDGG